MGDLKAYSNNKTFCTYINPKGIKCKSIALRKSLYCRHHVQYDTSLKDVTLNQNIQQSRYGSRSETVRARINNNLNAPGLLDLRHEIALLQAWLQELMEAPVTHFEKQLQVIDRIERLVTNFQRIRLSAQALAQAENKVKLVINNLVLIIKAVVSNKEERQEIARRMAELGQQYEIEQQSATLGLTTAQSEQESFINTEALSINKQEPFIKPSPSASPGTERAETGDPAAGAETGSEIPSPPREQAPG